MPGLARGPNRFKGPTSASLVRIRTAYHAPTRGREKKIAVEGTALVAYLAALPRLYSALIRFNSCDRCI